MTALHVLGADHFWSYVPMYVVLGLFLFVGSIALRTKLQRTLDNEKRPDPNTRGERSDNSSDDMKDS
ncbi:MAG: hypothetical protein O2826_02935 [Chloroflexi bacterium]|nr:hypothetical protein [Chloroflexota bacterium]MDA1173456.1 hypothetical protein [Chloroflexota bacterium]